MTAAIEGFASRTADLEGVTLHYWIGGDADGPPVLLWHGFLGTSYTWRKVAPLLAAAGHAVLVPDMRGYGDSDKPEGTDGYDANALADEFRRLVAVTGFGSGRPLTIAAHDMGAPAALLWAAHHPEEVAGLAYLEEPVLLQDVIAKVLAFNRDAMQRGSLWWWVLAQAPDAPDRLVVGNERSFLAWFYERDPSTRASIEPEAIDEYLRTFSGAQGVHGALGVYRAVFTTMEQTAPLVQNKVSVPVVALGGERGQGDRVREMVSLVASNVRGGTVAGSGHFLPEEQPEAIVQVVAELSLAHLKRQHVL